MRHPGSVLLGLALLVAGCTSPGAASTTTASPSTTTLPSTTALPSTTTLPSTTAPPIDVPALARGVLLVGLPGTTLDPATAAHLAAGGRGLILMQVNIGTAAQVRSLTGAAACAASGPLLVAVDQELGRVARLQGLVTPLPATEEAREMTPLEMEITAQLLGDQMLALGINVDLAPVLDVVTGANAALEGRHLGDDPALVADLGVAFLRGLQQAGVVAVPKHFPGHGRAAADPHYEVVRVAASLSDLEATDFPPFFAAFAAGARAVMVGHPIYEALDPSLPASLSPAVLDLLRADFDFDGVAVTDALNMEGVAAGRDPGELAVLALTAGEDLVLVIDPNVVEETIAAIVAAVATGALPLERLQEAAERVRDLAVEAAPIVCAA